MSSPPLCPPKRNGFPWPFVAVNGRVGPGLPRVPERPTPDAEEPRAAAVRETDEGGGGVGPLEDKLRQPVQRTLAVLTIVVIRDVVTTIGAGRGAGERGGGVSLRSPFRCISAGPRIRSFHGFATRRWPGETRYVFPLCTQVLTEAFPAHLHLLHVGFFGIQGH